MRFESWPRIARSMRRGMGRACGMERHPRMGHEYAIAPPGIRAFAPGYSWMATRLGRELRELREAGSGGAQRGLSILIINRRSAPTLFAAKDGSRKARMRGVWITKGREKREVRALRAFRGPKCLRLLSTNAAPSLQLKRRSGRTQERRVGERRWL
jgi:hypothetical protein